MKEFRVPGEGECYKFLGDESELRWFWKYCVPGLKPNEVYFMSTSARNKKLDEEERKFFQVGRSEMWKKEIVTEDDYSKFLRGIRRLETNKYAYLTKSGLPYPDKVLVLYFNIVPTDAYRAMQEQILNLMGIQREMTDSVLKGSEAALLSSWKNVRNSHTTGQSVFARSFSNPTWIDIDMDVSSWKQTVDGWRVIDEVKNFLADQLGLGNFVQVWTAGGWHWLLRSSALREMGRRIRQDPVTTVIGKMKDMFQYADMWTEGDEIVRNKNEMIPLPGTIQYGDHVVTVANKEDFRPEQALHGEVGA